jgi:peptide chain release factor 1
MGTKSSEQLFSYLEKVHSRFQELSDTLSQADTQRNPRRLRDLSRELSSLKPLHAKHEESRRLLTQIQEAESLQFSADPEMAEMAREELLALQARRAELEEEIQVLMVSDQVDDNRNVFLEIRAGAGGHEASLFAADLLRMYMRVAERKKWKAEVASTTWSAVGGIKEVILYVRGQGVNRYLRFESGVHRVQRVPVTEASGRIHTSTVTVAVLPEVEEVDVEINAKDIRIDTYAASGPGGQHVNKTESAIRITHFPSGIVVTCQDEKSQHKNKDKAMKMLQARIFEFERSRRQQDIADNRRAQVGTGERSEKIRTYNFPQSRVTDHRVESRNFNISLVLDGDLDNLAAELGEIHVRRLIEEKIAALAD